MARARNIKPGFFDNEHLAKCSRDARLLFIALWQLADCEGRLEDRPERIRKHAFSWDDDITTEKVDALLSELAKEIPEDKPFIVRYRGVDGLKCIQVTTFRKNQNLTKDEREGQSKLPPPKDYQSPTEVLPKDYQSPTEVLPKDYQSPTEVLPKDYQSPTQPLTLKSEIGNMKSEVLKPEDGKPLNAAPVNGNRSLLSQKFMVPIGEGLDSPPFHDAWGRWLAYLSVKDPYTVLDTLNAQMAFMARAGPSAAIAAIDRSIAAGSKKLWLEERKEGGKHGPRHNHGTEPGLPGRGDL